LQLQKVALQQQLDQLQGQKDTLSQQLADLNQQTAKLFDDQNELLKLRGEVGVLRQQTDELAQAKAELAAFRQKATDVEQAADAVASDQARFEGNQSAMVNAEKTLLLAMRVYANSHNNQYPTSLEQLTNELSGEVTIAGVNQQLTNVISASGTISGVNLSSIEWWNTTTAEPVPNAVVLREHNSRRAPDGVWYRIYGFGDGSVQTASSTDGDFTVWENNNTYQR
jgi:chromosome segregation ATPase